MSKLSLYRRIKYFFSKSFDIKTQVLIRVAISGVVIGIVGVAFRVATDKLSYLLYGGYYTKEHWYEWLYLPLICTSGGLLAGYITQKYAPDAAGSGIQQVKYALNTEGVVIKLRTIIVKFFGAIIAIASGLSLGREGPTIQIGAGLGSKISNLLGGQHRKRSIASGAGAGLAAAFNTPIAGVLFVIEELDRDFSSISLGPAIVGSVCAAVTCRLLYGDFFTFQFQSSGGTGFAMMPLYIVLGVITGVLGMFFQKSLLWGVRFYKKITVLPKWSFGAIAGLITGIVGLWLPEAIGGGHVTLEGTLAQAYVWWIIPLIFIFKYILTVIAYGSGVPGGIFAPALVLGALIGANLGNSIHVLFPGLDINPATFAFVGMGAFFAGVSRAPITSIVMLFELTGNYNLVLPLMFGCIIANIAAEKLHVGSIYENLLKEEGIELKAYSAPSYLSQFTVGEAMTQKTDTISDTMNLGDLYKLFESSTHTGFPVLNRKKELVGIVTKRDVQSAFDKKLTKKTLVTKFMSSDLKILGPKDSLHTAILMLYEYKIGRVLIVDPHHTTKLLGIITRSDIINFEANKELDH